MIWDDPWTIVASQPGGTRLPPPRYPLRDGLSFRAVQVTDLSLNIWIDLVGTLWSVAELSLRLEGAWIPCLYDGDRLVATCVIRQKPGVWILETLRARKGFGSPLLYSTIPWLFGLDPTKQTVLGYTWELDGPGLLAAWWRGWITATSTVQYGWVWSGVGAGCSFCGRRREALPMLFQDASGSAVVSDSGLADGWGYVSMICGAPNWTAIAERGGWTFWWTRSTLGPKGWIWTGEFVVVGFLNCLEIPTLDWVTAEIA